ncbi:hypothetical protein [Nonomuraea helvata]|uniref:Type II toxin-antitoxin system HicB family antitoxin n=1 Tax=Nonomuraea helvata TaxID=37484 RepID=A0ABV5S7A8_9ACTN
MMNHEAIFDQPDLIPSGEDTDLPVATTYHATATRTGKLWTAIAELPGGHTVQAQGATWADVRSNIAGLIFDTLKAEPGTVGVHLAPADPDAAAAIAAVYDARQARVLAEQAERDAVRRTARLLKAQGWNTRDSGSALSMSHQRMSQILAEPAA